MMALKAIVESRQLTKELLRDFFIQAETLLNGRELTHVSLDPVYPEPFRPNHFFSFKDFQILKMMALEKRNYILGNYVDQLLALMAARVPSNYYGPSKMAFYKKNLVIDDIALVVTPNSPSGHWPIDQVTRIVLSPD
jgi:hypothetical protein